MNIYNIIFFLIYINYNLTKNIYYYQRRFNIIKAMKYFSKQSCLTIYYVCYMLHTVLKTLNLKKIYCFIAETYDRVNIFFLLSFIGKLNIKNNNI